ncbi:hypothetical protein RHGRI_017661 [Rhododendron griersonianum]|uniref:Uncharacterized protein n=1 Tax=Rhododendron griersonianum TaxID=479676 RepID=A0AAV6JYM1_9ERIC|nr:hypothetical protein RHGRI_017661 [Rhododendron griersonianum]
MDSANILRVQGAHEQHVVWLVKQLHKILELCGSPSEDYWRKSKLPHSTVFKPLQPYKQRLVETFKDFPKRLAETFKDFPPLAVRLMETLLSVDPENWGTAASALKSEQNFQLNYQMTTGGEPTVVEGVGEQAATGEEEAGDCGEDLCGVEDVQEL